MTKKAMIQGRKYLNFVLELNRDNKKTNIWHVFNRERGFLLGHIKWYGAWRQYCFFPLEMVVFSSGCLNDISSFIKEIMDERKKTAKK